MHLKSEKDIPPIGVCLGSKRNSLIGTLKIILPFITLICNAGTLVTDLI